MAGPVDAEVDALADIPPATEPVDPGWRTDTAGRQFISRPGVRGMVYRRGQESVAEALQRDAQGPDPKPPKRKKPKSPPPSQSVDLRVLEQTLAEALKSPALVAGMVGDEWLTNHFVDKGPYLARNLVKASETNPWLRRKLETLATGGDAAVQLLSALSLVGAVGLYLAPPVIYLLNLNIPPMAREMLDVPQRRPPAPAPPPPVTYHYAPPPQAAPEEFDAEAASSTESPVDIPIVGD